jgi:hypothetical protein
LVDLLTNFWYNTYENPHSMHGLGFLALVTLFGFVVYQPPALPSHVSAEPLEVAEAEVTEVSAAVPVDLPFALEPVDEVRGQEAEEGEELVEENEGERMVAMVGGAEDPEDAEDMEKSENILENEPVSEESETPEEEYVEDELEGAVLVLSDEELITTGDEQAPQEESIVEQLMGEAAP